MKQYCVSYITNEGVTVLNCIIKAESRSIAIEDIKDEANIILSVVPIKH